MNAPFTPAAFGFDRLDDRHWRKLIRNRTIEFRELHTLDELAVAEWFQRAVMSFTEADTVAANFLVIVPDTGGFVLGAFDAGMPLGVAVGWGGYQHPEPFLYSDLLAVVPETRSLGIGFEMKRLQAALARERGFAAIRWTVDPLRAANARLNFERLGALGMRYTRDKYGASLGIGLYGGLPTDRLLIRWPLHSERTTERLTGDYVPHPPGSLDGLEAVSAKSIGALQLTISIPAEIDELVHRDFDLAMRYRLDVRATTELAFEAGYFISGAARDGDGSLLLLEPAAMFEETGTVREST